MLYLKSKEKVYKTLSEFDSTKNKVLIKRRCGGLGDILMMRMLFEDLHYSFPDLEFTFACPRPYSRMMEEHPFAKAISLDYLDEKIFSAVYDLTTACSVHEMKTLHENCKHRSDIWANYLGIELKNHNMHLQLNEEAEKVCKDYKRQIGKRVVLLSMQSVDNDFGLQKQIDKEEIKEFIQYLVQNNYFVISTHIHEIEWLKDLPVHQHIGIDYQYWFSLVNMSNYVVAIDSATLHIAGGLGIPTLGIFTVTNGNVYCKYYPKTLVLQGNCPFGKSGCFNYYRCEDKTIPCKTNINANIMINYFENLIANNN